MEAVADTAPATSPKLTWFACVYPVANVKRKPAEVKAIVGILEEIVRLLRERDDMAECYIASHSAPSHDQEYGGVRHVRRLEENMVVSANDFYLKICMNSHNIREVHIIAGESGAYLAVRILNFWVKHGNTFQYDPSQFDLKWAEFLASGETCRDVNSRSKLIGNFILVSPSLPSPSGISKMLWGIIRPPIYKHKKLVQTGGEVIIVPVEAQQTHLELVDISGTNVKYVERSALKGILQEFFPAVFPVLKAAVAMMLDVLKVVDRAGENKQEYGNLGKRINGIELIISDYKRLEHQRALDLPIQGLTENIIALTKQIRSLQGSDDPKRTAEDSRDSEWISKIYRDIGILLQNFQLDTVLNTDSRINLIQTFNERNARRFKYSEDVSHRAQQERGCMKDTRVKVLDDLETWASDDAAPKVCWFNGMAGTGKTSVSHTFCERLDQKLMLGASFFCSRELQSSNDAGRIVPSIAYMLGRTSPPLQSAICKVLEHRPGVVSDPLLEQFHSLLVQPIQDVVPTSVKTYKIIVIDAIDECSELSTVESLIEAVFNSVFLPLKFFITSRPEFRIRGAFQHHSISHPNHQTMVEIPLHEVPRDVVQNDIQTYLRNSLSEIAGLVQPISNRLPEQEFRKLLTQSDGLFLYAAAAIQHIKSALTNVTHPGETSWQHPTSMDRIYDLIMSQAFRNVGDEEKSARREVLAAVVFLKTSLSMDGIATLLGLSNAQTERALSPFHSVIRVPSANNGHAFIFHASFREFIVNPDRCGGYSMGASEGHHMLTVKCLRFLNAFLRRNICGLPEDNIGSNPHEIRDINIIPEALRYSCLHWSSHLIDSLAGPAPVFEHLLTFAEEHLLHWLECLSALGELESGLESLAKLNHGILKQSLSHESILELLFADAYEGLLTGFELIRCHCLNAYGPALAGIPTQSPLRKQCEYPPSNSFGHAQVVVNLWVSWRPLKHDMQQPKRVTSPAHFSPDGSHVVSGSDRSVMIWNSTTGDIEHVLEGHSAGVTSVAFSPDGKRVVSGSADTTARIWDVITGKTEHVLEGYSGQVPSVAFSPDGTYASVSDNNTVRLWNVATGETHRVLDGHLGQEKSVGFSPDGTRMLSGTNDDTSMSLSDPVTLSHVALARSTRFTQSGRQDDLKEAISWHRKALELRPASHPDRPMFLDNLASALSTRFTQFGYSDDLAEAILLYQQALKLRPAYHPDRAMSLINLASALSTRFAQSGQHKDLDQAISLHEEALELQPAFHPDRSKSLSNLALALQTQFEVLGRSKDLDKAVALHREALTVQPASHPDRSISFGNLASALWRRFEHMGRHEDLEEAILLHRDALKLRPASHPDRSISLSNLASTLWKIFEQLGRREDLDEAIMLHRQALELQPDSHPDRYMFLDNLASALSTRFTQSGRNDDLEEAISLHREALELQTASHPDRSKSLSNLALAVRKKFEVSGQRLDLEEAISLHRTALQLRPASHPDRSISLGNLASTLWRLFEQSGQREDLEEAILLHREALELLPASHPDRPMFLNNLASALSTRFTQFGYRDDLEEAILLYRQALEIRPASHPDQSMFLTNLASALSTQFSQLGQREDLEEAILLHRMALELLHASHPDRSMFFNNLASTLSTLFTQSGRRDVLEEAILLHRKALELLPASHPDRSISLRNLASTLWRHFEQFGGREDLEEAILLHRQALELLPASHPYRYMSPSNLALSLSARFEQSGHLHDLEEAILLHRYALELLPASHPDRAKSLSNLALALQAQFEQSGHRHDLEEAILLHRDALVLLTISHSDRSAFLNHLAFALSTRFTQSGRRDDLEEAISLYRQALELTPASHPDRSKILSNLALALSTRFKEAGRREDLEEAIYMSDQSLQILVTGHPSTCLYSRNHGDVLFVAYSHTNDPQYLHRAMDSFRVAVTCEAAPAPLRFRVAREWANLADSRHDSALEAYHAAIQLLPHLARPGLDLLSRQALTSSSDGLARAAAACAIRSCQLSKAVELLEEGRAVFWSQALQLRTPMDHLRGMAPELGEKLKRIASALEQGSLRNVSRDLSEDARRVITMEREASYFRRLEEEWLQGLEEVRRFEGFQDFLRPSRISTLLSAAADAPLVILNASGPDCAALILTSAGVQHVPLPDLTDADVNRLVESIQISTRPGIRRSSLSISNRTGSVHEDLAFQFVLGTLWQSVVKPVILQLGLEKSEEPIHLRWCPTGAFAFLPIHAAGIYGTDEPENVSEYVVSSYTPTISALLRDTPLSSAPFKMMVVTHPQLPYSIDELKRIAARVPVTNLVGLQTFEEVISHLPTASIAHFACYGTQHPYHPLESALLLQHNIPLTVSRIMQLSISNARLAFLGACSTATGDKNLPDEAIHLASALLFAGFSGVVATMWEMTDADGSEVADAFYEYLFKETHSDTADIFQPDTTRAARALHFAVAKLRDKGVPFRRWVSFIHLGR